jgi:hypothetical protein
MMKYKDLHTWAWLNGFYERWRYGDGFGRSHETDHDWNEAYDSGANASDYLTENWGWVWTKLIRTMLIGALGIIFGAAFVWVVIHEIVIKCLIGVLGLMGLWLAGRWTEYIWREIRKDFGIGSK